MSDFQEQAKNWLRNVVKQNPDKIKAGVEKAGDLIDKQTGGKHADKVDAVQQKVGTYVDSQSTETAEQGGDGEASAQAEQPQSSAGEAGGGVPEAGGGGDPEAGGGVVGGDAPDPSSEPASSAGSRPECTQTGGTVTGATEGDESSRQSEGGLPGPRS